MKIVQTRVWRHLTILKGLLKHWYCLDIMNLFTNAPMHALVHDREIVAFLRISPQHLLGSLYTPVRHRKKGYATELIRRVLE